VPVGTPAAAKNGCSHRYNYRLSANRQTRIVAASLALFVLNAWVVWKLFFVAYTKQLQSNEGSFIAISRVMRDHPSDLLWWPMWNLGIPFHHTYFPFLHALDALVSALSNISPAMAYHSVTALFYCLGPVTVFWLATRISGRLAPSFGAALAYAFLSPSAWLIPSVARDNGGLWSPRRLQVLIYYGEGPHIAALTLVPVGLLFLYEFWRAVPGSRRQACMGLLAGIFAAFTALTNAFGAMTLALGALCLLAALPRKEMARAATQALAVALVVYAAVCSLIPPSVLHTISVNAPTVDGVYHYTASSWAALAGLVLGFVLLWLAMEWKPATLWTRFIVLFAWLLSGITLLNFVQVYVLAQPGRYQEEMEMALLLCLAFGAEALLRDRSRTIQLVLLAVALIFMARQIRVHKLHADHLVDPVDITTTPEYKMASWMDSHAAGGRVFVGGSYGFWTNVFSDVPQVSGGHEPTSLNPLQRMAAYEIYLDPDGERTVKWLRALGVSQVGVPASNTFKHPEKFDSLLPLAWKDGADRIYQVPQRHPGLAHVISRQSLVSRTPADGLDTDPLTPYLAALNDPALPDAEMHWLNFHQAQISAEVRPGQVISVQENYDPGWTATVKGQGTPVRADALGFLTVEPPCDGPCQVDLLWDGGPERRTTTLIGAATLSLVACWLVWRMNVARTLMSAAPRLVSALFRWVI
jgi:hypothetical protein